MRINFLGVLCKPPRKLQFFFAAYKIRHGIIFSWLLTSTTKVTIYSLAVQTWPPRKSLAAKVIRFWCSDAITPRKCGIVPDQHICVVGFKVLRNFYANCGESVQPLQSVKLTYQPCSRSRVGWTLT